MNFENLNLDEQEFGFGTGSAEDIVALNKALEAGYGTDVATFTGGAALRVQSLESTLKVLTFQEKHCVFWKKIPKKPAFSTVEEYSQLVDHGTENPGFVPEGVAPEEDDASYARKVSLVKFLGTTRKVTHPMTLVKTVGGDPIALQTTSGILKIMRDAEFGLFFGNSKLAFNNAEGYEFDGINTLIQNEIDMGNRNVEQSTINLAAEIVFDNYGFATDLFCSTAVAKILGDSGVTKERVFLPVSGGEVAIGFKVGKIITQYGEIEPNPDVFLAKGRTPKKTPPTVATSAKAPTAPASIAGGIPTGSTGKWRSSQVGTYKFQATACNRYGESAPTALSAGVAIGSSDLTKVIPLTITNAANVVIPPEWFNIYVTEPDGSTTYLIAQVPAASQANGGTTTYNYDGYIMPNTTIAYVGQLTEDVICFKQLAPIMKMDLAVIDPSYRFMILLYGTPQLYAPKKWVKIINIKDY